MAEENLFLSWEKYSRPDVFEHLRSIRDFSVRVQFPQFESKEPEDSRRAAVDRLYREVLLILQKSEFGALEQLRRVAVDSTTKNAIEYREDPWEFSVLLENNLDLRLRRPGSSFQRFYEWYVLFMPNLHTLVSGCCEEYEAIVNENLASPISVRPVRVAYSFRFLLHSLGTSQRRRDVKNSHVLKSMLTRIPGQVGVLVDVGDAEISDLGRIDVNVSRWVNSPTGRIREVYRLEAPGNRNYGAVWVDFSYIAETDSTGMPPYTTPNMMTTLERVDIPILDFLQAKCLRAFLTEIMSGLVFESTSGGLP